MKEKKRGRVPGSGVRGPGRPASAAGQSATAGSQSASAGSQSASAGSQSASLADRAELVLLRAEKALLRAEKLRLLRALVGVVGEAIGADRDRVLGGGSAEYDAAIRLLAELGCLRIVDENGPALIAEWVEPAGGTSAPSPQSPIPSPATER